MDNTELTAYIKSQAKSLGFTACGIAQVTAVNEETQTATNSWIANGNNGDMGYMERNTDKRYNPSLLVPGSRSIICVALNYYNNIDEERLYLSRYAQGNDYHKIVKDKLYTLLGDINKHRATKGRAFCDSAPILERYWAVKAGLGRIGKNRQLIIPKAGSYFFLGELIVDIELDYDTPLTKDICGNCDRCLRACPTQALTNGDFDARKCLSYLTIEYRGDLPKNIGEMMGNCFYGCDRCQTNCPHNNHPTPTTEEGLKAKNLLQSMEKEDWEALTKEKYEELFGNSAVERCGYELLKRNLAAVKKI